MARHAQDSRRGLASVLVFALMLPMLVFNLIFESSITPAFAVTCSGSSSDVTVIPLHGRQFHADLPTYDAGFLGYQVSSSANISDLNVEVSISANSVIQLASGQPVGQNFGSLSAGSTASSFVFIEYGSAITDATITVTVKDGSTTICSVNDTVVIGDTSTIAAAANKIYGVSVNDGGVADLKPGSRVVLTVRGDTGTLGAGGDRSFTPQYPINLVPVSIANNFRADAWQLVETQFVSSDPNCPGTLVNYLYLAETTTPDSRDCVGKYSVNYIFTARASFTEAETQESQVQAFAYIGSGTQIKHTDPYASILSFPVVTSASSNVVDATAPTLAAADNATLTYDANGGSGTVPTSYTAAVGDMTLASPTDLSRTNYTFSHWSISGVAYNPGATYPLWADATAFAQWKQFTLTYDSNGADSGTTQSPLVGYGSQTLDNNAGSLAKSGFTFGGWSINGSDYASGGSYTLTSNQTATAIWIAAGASYTLTYDLNGGVSTSPIADQTGVGVVALDSAANISRDNYQFSHWSISGVAYSASANFTLADATAYAQWVQYTLTYDANGADSGATQSAIVGFGSKTLDNNAGTLGKTGYTFGGWSINGTDYDSGASYILASNQTATAIWIGTLIYDVNGGISSSPIADQSGSGTVTLDSAGNISRDNYKFSHWSISGVSYAASATFTLINATAYAQWVQYTLTYDSNGSDGGTTQSAVVGYGSKTLDNNAGSLTKDGYTFGGWTINGVTYASGGSYTLASNQTATAIWNAVTPPAPSGGGGSSAPSYLVSFNGNGHTSGTVPASLITSNQIVVPEAGVTKEGSTFGGWVINGVTYQPGAVVTITGTTTATALWLLQIECAVAETQSEYRNSSNLIEYFLETMKVLAMGLANTVGLALEAFLKTDTGGAITVLQPLTANPLIGKPLVDFGSSQVFGVSFLASPKKGASLEPADITIEPGVEPGSVEISSNTGDPLEIDGGVQSVDLDLYVAYTGAELNNPLVWQNEGYGSTCWKLEPFDETFFFLPDPIEFPGSTPDGEWVYSNVIVKAGSLTADPTTFQVNTLFPGPGKGEMVWADVNGNGVYDPGGKGGDKAISHIVICVTKVSVTPTPTDSPVATESPQTPEATPSPSESPTTPTSTTTSTPVPTVTPTATPTPSVSPTPTGSPCPTPTKTSTVVPTVAPPSPTPTQSSIVIFLRTPQPSPTPTETSPAPEPGPVTSSPPSSPSPSPTESAPEPTPTSTPSPTETASSEPTPSPTQPGSGPTTTPTPGPTATPLAPIDPNPPTTCEADSNYGVALKVSNGLGTLCYRVTTAYFFSLATFPRESDEEVALSPEGELADTGFEFAWLTLIALLLAGTGALSIAMARARD